MADQNVDLRFRAQDAGASATIKKVQGSVQQLPDAFGRSATALNAMSSASTQMSGAAADMAAKMTNVGALMMSGGLVGVAIGAATLAIGGLTTAYELHRQETDWVGKAHEMMAGYLSKATAAIGKQRDKVEDLRNQIKYWGQDTQQVEIAMLKQSIEMKKIAIDYDQRNIDSRRERADLAREEASRIEAEIKATGHRVTSKVLLAEALRRQAEEEETAAEETQRVNDITRSWVVNNMNKLDALKQIVALTKRDAEAKKQAAAAVGDLAQRRKDLAAMDLEVLGLKHAETQGMVELSNSVAATELANIDRISQTRIAAIDANAMAMDADARRQDQLIQQTEANYRQLGMSIGQTMGNAFALMVTDSENAGKHMTTAVVDAAQMSIMAYAASGAAAAAFASAGIPIIGPILAATSAAIVFGLIKGFLADVPSFSQGGVVPGVDRGVDDTLVAARPGEVIFTPEQMAAMQNRGGGLHLHTSSVLPATGVEVKRQLRALGKEQLELRQMGFAV